MGGLMELEITQKGSSGEWEFRLNDERLSEAAQAVLAGSDRVAGDIFATVIALFGGEDRSPESMFCTLNDAVERAQQWVDTDSAVSLPHTYGEAIDTLSNVAAIALWAYSSGIASLERNNVGKAVHAFMRAAEWHSAFQTSFTHLLESAESPRDAGPAHALAHRPDQRIKPAVQQFLRELKESGAQINQIDDLLNVEGCPVGMPKISAATLRKWARAEGFTFKPGRPKSSMSRSN